MTRKFLIFSSLLIFTSAGVSAYVSNKIWPRCKVVYAYNSDKTIDSKELCYCAISKIAPDISRFTLSVEKVSYDKKWLRFTLSSDGLDDVFGFMQLEDGKWKLIDLGTAIDDEDMDKYRIPEEVRPGYISAF